MQAMILAAGFGTRLKPYSLVKPKPLFPVLNKPLLIATIDRLKHAGFSKIIVNTHYLRAQIVKLLDGIPGVIVQEETEILGTGGGLRRAMGTLSDEPVLVTNGDIYHTIDYRFVYEKHHERRLPVTMVLHDYPRFNTVCLQDERVRGFSAGPGSQWAYTGIQVVEPEILEKIPLGRAYCIIEHYRNLLENGITIHGLILKDTNWTDMGTPADYLALHGALLAGTVPVWDEFSREGSGSTEIASGAFMGAGSRIVEWGCIGAARIGDRAIVSRSVIWDGARVSPGRHISDSIVMPQ